MRHLFSTPLGQEIAPKATFKNSWVGAAIGAVGSLAGGLLNNQANANLNKTNRDWQTARDYTNFQRQKELFDYENAYNTPLEQRKRLQEAGFNPWISGSGGYSNTGQIPSAPAMSGAPSSIPMQDVVGPAVQNGVNTYMQSKALDAQVANQSAKTLKESLDVYKEARMNGMSKQEAMEVIEPFIKASQGMNDSNRYLDMVDKQIIAQDWQNKQSELSYSINSELSRIERITALQKSEQEITNLAGELGLMSSQSDLNRQKIKESVSTVVRNIADAYHLRKAGDKYAADARTINGIRDLVIEGLNFRNTILSNSANDAGALNDAKSGFRNWLISDEGRKEVTHKYRLQQQGSVDALQIVSGIWNDVMPSVFTGSSVNGNGQKYEYGNSSSDVFSTFTK